MLKIQFLRKFRNIKTTPVPLRQKKNKKHSKFTFHQVDNEKIVKEIKRLNKNKASQKSDILTTIIYENADVFADFLAESLKGAIKTYNFPNCLKLANITLLHKKGRKSNKENYRLISILRTLSKILVRTLFNQMPSYFYKFTFTLSD